MQDGNTASLYLRKSVSAMLELIAEFGRSKPT